MSTRKTPVSGRSSSSSSSSAARSAASSSSSASGLAATPAASGTRAGSTAGSSTTRTTLRLRSGSVESPTAAADAAAAAAAAAASHHTPTPTSRRGAAASGPLGSRTPQTPKAGSTAGSAGKRATGAKPAAAAPGNALYIEPDFEDDDQDQGEDSGLGSNENARRASSSSTAAAPIEVGQGEPIYYREHLLTGNEDMHSSKWVDIGGELVEVRRVRAELRWAARECTRRGLLHSASWATEMAWAVATPEESEAQRLATAAAGGQETRTGAAAIEGRFAGDPGDYDYEETEEDFEMQDAVEQEYLDPLWNMQTEAREADRVAFAKSLFDMREYDRVAHILRNAKGHTALFLRWYSRYLAGERRSEEETDATSASIFGDPLIVGTSTTTAGQSQGRPQHPQQKQLGPNAPGGSMGWATQGTPVSSTRNFVKNKEVKSLHTELSALYEADQLDSFGLYMYALILRAIELDGLALTILVEAADRCPLNWAVWTEIADLCDHELDLDEAPFGDHWIREVFETHLERRLQRNDSALERSLALASVFGRSAFIWGEAALAAYNKRDYTAAMDAFSIIRILDPHRLDSMDVLSNMLFVKERSQELGTLAQTCTATDKYRPETCCVVGNFYAMRCEHEKAVVFFQRALRLDRNFGAAWLLMGHEYIELRNMPAAVEAYRRASAEVNQIDFRAWYALGQGYELLKLFDFALLYYEKALKLRPEDSRMHVAVGTMHEKLNMYEDALRCYSNAEQLGDSEGVVVAIMCNMYMSLKIPEMAVIYCKKCVETYGQDLATATAFVAKVVVQALLYLAQYYFVEGERSTAETYATKDREEAKRILQAIHGRSQ
ncbi:cell division cycle protein 23 [Capsaspora owczarzaki ATCC 30864]|uniref:Cell division cycle protein 23 n=1 Tax=Capsaspora owczarzaki (strain ATCC 30864) TaxID=595528 RepID=A0A0D2UAW0_CAPO3|nr:cell division cycle protein 23 [Capsaspora owczarzaki ATCC 30864]